MPRLYEGEHAYILQNEDRRIVFAIPYLERFTLIGTTDREYQGDPAKVAISAEETAYLLDVVNRHFKQQIGEKDILRTYSGVRPLCDDESDDPSAVTRDYTLSLEAHPGEAPLLSVFGGKLTTYRKLAESALAQLAPFFPNAKPSWTASQPLPGGEQMNSQAELAEALCNRFGWLPDSLARRWAGTYGSRTWRCWTACRTSPTWANTWAVACTRVKWITCAARSGPPAWTTSSGAAPSSACS